MISIFPIKQDFDIKISPTSEWTISREIEISVTLDGVVQREVGTPLPRMPWERAYRALVERLDCNEHQVDAMGKGLFTGRTLRFKVRCSRSDLVTLGFLRS
jgi:hypothetical protein